MSISPLTLQVLSKLVHLAGGAGLRLSLLLILQASLFSAVAMAHPEGFSGTHVTVHADRIRVAITVHTRDMGAWFPPARFPDYVADVTREMESSVEEIVELQIEGNAQKHKAVKAFLLEVGLIEIDVDYQYPVLTDPTEILIWSKHLIRLPRGHQQLLFVEDRRMSKLETAEGVILLDDVLSVERDAAAAVLPVVDVVAAETEKQMEPDAAIEGQSQQHDQLPTSADSRREPKTSPVADRPTSRISFFRFGVEHILSGYDHLLFLAALLLACATFLEAAKIITCFTVAHSITLAMAALDVVRLSASIVEPLIALSIIYVAIENLSSKPSLGRRVAITFFFGLIHGLGFASALREIGLGTIPGGILWPLLKFNLGVEAGQLCVAAILLPLLLLAKRSERRTKVVVPVGSCLVALVGAYWLVTRVVGN